MATDTIRFKLMQTLTSLVWLVDGFVCLDYNHPTRAATETDELFVHKHLPHGGSDSEVELPTGNVIMVGKLRTDR